MILGWDNACQIASYKVNHFPPFRYSAVRKEAALLSPHSKCYGIMRHFLEGTISMWVIWNFLLWEICLSSCICLFTHSYQYRLISVSLNFEVTPILTFLFCCLNVPALALGALLVSWVPNNWCFWTVVLEKTIESPLDCREIQLVHPKGDQSWVFIGRTNAEAETPVLWPPDGTHLKRPWCWERLRAGGEGDNRGWDGWMASVTQWTGVWVHSGSWWWTGRPGVLQFMGSQRVWHNWATELTDYIPWTCLHSFVSWAFSYFLALHHAAGSSSLFSAIGKLVIPPRSPVFFFFIVVVVLFKNSITYQYLGAGVWLVFYL